MRDGGRGTLDFLFFSFFFLVFQLYLFLSSTSLFYQRLLYRRFFFGGWVGIIGKSSSLPRSPVYVHCVHLVLGLRELVSGWYQKASNFSLFLFFSQFASLIVRHRPQGQPVRGRAEGHRQGREVVNKS